MLAALLALRLYYKDVQDLTVLFKIDNTSTVSSVNQQSGNIYTSETILGVSYRQKYKCGGFLHWTKEKQGSRQRISKDKR